MASRLLFASPQCCLLGRSAQVVHSFLSPPLTPIHAIFNFHFACNGLNFAIRYVRLRVLLHTTWEAKSKVMNVKEKKQEIEDFGLLSDPSAAFSIHWSHWKHRSLHYPLTVCYLLCRKLTTDQISDLQFTTGRTHLNNLLL